MYFLQKLKPDRSIVGLLPAIFSLVIFSLTSLFWGIKTGLIVLSGLFLIFSGLTFVAYIRTRNSGFIVNCLYIFFMGLYLGTIPTNAFQGTPGKFSLFCLIGAITFALWLVYLVSTRKLKWRGREILELAAAPVETTVDGYTARPHPVGQVTYSKPEILEFAAFAVRHLMVMPYLEKNRVVLVPVRMGKEFGILYKLNYNYTNETWIAFDFDGKVAVNISREDYLEYQDEFAFDQLCESLGNLFIEFLELYQKGNGSRIIDRMDAMKICVFS